MRNLQIVILLVFRQSTFIGDLRSPGLPSPLTISGMILHVNYVLDVATINLHKSQFDYLYQGFQLPISGFPKMGVPPSIFDWDFPKPSSYWISPFLETMFVSGTWSFKIPHIIPIPIILIVIPQIFPHNSSFPSFSSPLVQPSNRNRAARWTSHLPSPR